MREKSTSSISHGENLDLETTVDEDLGPVLLPSVEEVLELEPVSGLQADVVSAGADLLPDICHMRLQIRRTTSKLGVVLLRVVEEWSHLPHKSHKGLEGKHAALAMEFREDLGEELEGEHALLHQLTNEEDVTHDFLLVLDLLLELF